MTSLAAACAATALTSLPLAARAQATPQSSTTTPQTTTAAAQPDAAAQTAAAASPQAQLEAAKQVVDNLQPSAENGWAANRVAQLKQDFATFEAAFEHERSTSVPSGTTGVTPARVDTNLQASYTALANDLGELVRPAANRPRTGSAAPLAVSPKLRSQLERLQTHLQAFAVAEGLRTGSGLDTTLGVGAERTNAQYLLDRIDTIVSQVLRNAPASASGEHAVGTSGQMDLSGGKVTIDRARLEEIRAEVQRLEAMINPKQ